MKLGLGDLILMDIKWMYETEREDVLGRKPIYKDLDYRILSSPDKEY